MGVTLISKYRESINRTEFPQYGDNFYKIKYTSDIYSLIALT